MTQVIRDMTHLYSDMTHLYSDTTRSYVEMTDSYTCDMTHLCDAIVDSLWTSGYVPANITSGGMRGDSFACTHGSIRCRHESFIGRYGSFIYV